MAIRILIADNSVIVRRGLQSLLANVEEFILVGECVEKNEIQEQILLKKPDVIIADTSALNILAEDIKKIKKSNKKVKILAITGFLAKSEFKKTLDAGVTSFLLKECDREEIIEAVIKTEAGEQFLCGKIAEILTSDKEYKSAESLKAVSCAGFGITEREMEIVQLISEGLSNKQIADKLFLSTHTVNTHRKNIMCKLGVNNTAGVVMFAVKNRLLEPNQFLFSN
ncbi:MAG: response regulator transcription factor [Bacteroidia bacterium]|nr:response regulator transcription factor [Bacteroidia bacterium]